jgi:hypothetical protein
MLTWFPSLLPDELAPYSPLARYSHHMGYTIAKDVKRAAFGTDQVHISPIFTDSLDLLLENLPPNHQLTIDHLLLNHTLYPLYAPFTSEPSRVALRAFFTKSAVEIRKREVRTVNPVAARPTKPFSLPMFLFRTWFNKRKKNLNN